MAASSFSNSCSHATDTSVALRIGIIGSGALGSYFGIRLAAAGHQVSFLVRSDYEAVRRQGMRLTLEDGTVIAVAQPRVARCPDEMGLQDLVLIALKTTRNALFPELLPPVVGSSTALVTVQNGLGNVEALAQLFPANAILGALCQIGVNREGPGLIRSFVPGDGFVQLGAGPLAGADLSAKVQSAFEDAGIRTRMTPSLGEALWRKLMWNVPFNGLTVAIGGQGTEAVCGDASLRSVARALMEEIRLAANALGFPIEADYTDKLLGFTDKLGHYKASSVLDWQSGRLLEVEAIFRKPLQAGIEAGVEMPHLATLAAILDALNASRSGSAGK